MNIEESRCSSTTAHTHHRYGTPQFGDAPNMPYAQHEHAISPYGVESPMYVALPQSAAPLRHYNVCL